MVKTTEAFTFFLNKKLYKYKNNNLYQNNKKLGGVVFDIGKKCEEAIEDCIHDSNNKVVVGVGGFGKVSKFTCDGKTFVMKSSHNENEDIVYNEIMILMKLNFPGHMNIIEYLCSYENVSNNYIILPCAQKDLRLFLLEEKDTVTDEEQYAIMDNLLKGMDYMHKKHIIHNDIKDENILIMPDFSIKYCDFGLSFIIDTSTNEKKIPQINQVLYQGTKDYITPESFTFDDVQNSYEYFPEQYNTFVAKYKLYEKDYWCLGIVFYHILKKTDEFPYSIKKLLKRDSDHTKIPTWLKESLLNFDEFKRKQPDLKSLEVNVKNENTGPQSGGLIISTNNHKTKKEPMKEPKPATEQGKREHMKVQETTTEQARRITKNMISALEDIKRNNILYGDQPRLERRNEEKNRFKINDYSL